MTEPKSKLDPSKSRFAKKIDENKPTQEQFEGEVSEYQKEQAIMQQKITGLAKQFIDFIKDKTLNENKGPILLDMEKTVPKQLSEVSLKIDNDETTQEICLGSNGLILLLLKTSLIQRDIINELSFRVSKLEKLVESSQIKIDG